MVKLFNLRISRVTPSFQSCRSKDPSNLLVDPVPSFLSLSPNPIILDFPPTTPPPSQPISSSFQRCISSTFTSVGCGLGSKSRAPNSDDDCQCKSLEVKWQNEGKWHVVTQSPRWHASSKDLQSVGLWQLARVVKRSTIRRFVAIRTMTSSLLFLFLLHGRCHHSRQRRRKDGAEKRKCLQGFVTSSPKSGQFSNDSSDERGGQ